MTKQEAAEYIAEECKRIEDELALLRKAYEMSRTNFKAFAIRHAEHRLEALYMAIDELTREEGAE